MPSSFLKFPQVLTETNLTLLSLLTLQACSGTFQVPTTPVQLPSLEIQPDPVKGNISRL
ncbi:hypothetical protein BYT27DRAFT_7202470 [Phlegmacium glaucopus]|nr:hypothetical protein BYT27DRAFT_7202470 [Phlegmacium glaucopus]